MARFKKGQKKPAKSGRRIGVPNRTSMESRELARSLLDDVYYGALKSRLRNGTAPSSVECLILNYAHGRPKEIVKFEGDKRITVEQFRHLAGLYDDDDEPELEKPKPPPKAPAKVRVGLIPQKKKTKALARH